MTHFFANTESFVKLYRMFHGVIKRFTVGFYEKPGKFPVMKIITDAHPIFLFCVMIFFSLLANVVAMAIFSIVTMGCWEFFGASFSPFNHEAIQRIKK